MTRPIQLYQGSDMIIQVDMNDDISAATEIEFYIDTPDQIKKTLSDGEITGVTAAKFDVTLAAADTETVEKGFYQYQARATLGGLKHNIKFTPNRIHIKESVFVNPSHIKDYY